MAVRLTERKLRGPPWRNCRWGLGSAAGSAAFAAVYGLVELARMVTADTDRGTSFVTGGSSPLVPLALAWLSGLGTAVFLGTSLDDDQARPLLAWAPAWAPLAVLSVALALVIAAAWP